MISERVPSSVTHYVVESGCQCLVSDGLFVLSCGGENVACGGGEEGGGRHHGMDGGVLGSEGVLIRGCGLVMQVS